jgi:hypothetical protein
VLVVSTDPASNLDDVFGIDAKPEPTAVPGVDGLFVANLDPEAAAEAFKERAVAPYRGVLPESAVRNMEEQLSGACTVEIAAFNEFTAVLAAPQDTAQFDHVLFDTAPTGHTLRLLTLPSAWSGYVAEHPAGASCLGPLAGLDQQRQRYETAVTALADGELTTLVLVSRALALKLGDGGQLVLWQQARAPLADAGAVGDRAGDGLRVAGEHHDPAHADSLECLGEIRGLRPRLIGKPEHREHAGSLAERDRGLAGLVQCVDRCGHGPGTLGGESRAARPQCAAVDARATAPRPGSASKSSIAPTRRSRSRAARRSAAASGCSECASTAATSASASRSSAPSPGALM